MQPSFIEYVRNTARLIAGSHNNEVSIDMVRLDMLTHPPGCIPKIESLHQWGGVFKGCGWKLVGSRQSVDPRANGRTVKIWKLIA